MLVLLNSFLLCVKWEEDVDDDEDNEQVGSPDPSLLTDKIILVKPRSESLQSAANMEWCSVLLRSLKISNYLQCKCSAEGRSRFAQHNMNGLLTFWAVVCAPSLTERSLPTPEDPF